MKTLELQPINERCEVKTDTRLLEVLLAKELNVPMACKGKGICATCHVYVQRGHEQLTPPTVREKRSLAIISGAGANSRLACQCRVIGDGVVVELPDGMYFERVEELQDLVGTRAAKNILHPINGTILIAQGKIITRTRYEELKRLNADIANLQSTPSDH
jgi:ferredoxin